MWDPEYCDSQLRAVTVESSGESRDELCPSTPLNSTPADTAETLSQADRWYTCDQCPSMPTTINTVGITDAQLHPDPELPS